MSLFRHICLAVALLAGSVFSGVAQAAPAADPAAQLEALLKEHPELILNVLKEQGFLS